MQKAIRSIQSFTRFYCSMALQWEKNLLCKGYDIYEIRTLLELYFLGVCTPRELASRLDTRVEKMNCVLRQLKDAELIYQHTNEKDRLFGQVCLTNNGKEEAKKFQLYYDKSIASALGEIGEEEQNELVEHLKRVKDILQEVEIRKCELKAKANSSKIIGSGFIEL